MSDDLADIDDLVIDPGADGDHATVSWRRGSVWSSLVHDADDPDRIWDAEDALATLLVRRVSIGLIQRAVGRAYPEFDLGTWFDDVQMPDRAQRRADDQARRHLLKEEFRRTRTT